MLIVKHFIDAFIMFVSVEALEKKKHLNEICGIIGFHIF